MYSWGKVGSGESLGDREVDVAERQREREREREREERER